MRIYLGLMGLLLMSVFNTPQANTILTFNQALTIAYKNNPELQAEIDKAQALKGLFVQSGLYPNPLIALTAENIGGSGKYTGYEAAETTLSLTQPIPLGHRLHYLKRASYADYLTSLARIKVQKTMLYTQVGNTYIDAFYSTQWHSVTKKLVRLNQDIVKAIQHRVTAGAGAELDLRLAQVRLGDARIQENKAAREALIQRAKLARILNYGWRIDKTLAEKGLTHTQRQWSELLKKLPQSPQLIQMRLQMRAKHATITAVKKSVWPDLNIQLGGRHFSDDDSNALVASIYAQVPIHDRNQGKIMTAEAEYTQSMHAFQGTRLSVRQNLYTTFLQSEQSRFESDLATDSLLPLARKSIKLAKEGYQMGRYTYIELSLALNTLYEEERHYQQAHADYHKALIQITGILGWDDPKEDK